MDNNENTLFGMSFDEISMVATAKKMCNYGIPNDAGFVMSSNLDKLRDGVTKPILTKKPFGEREFYMALIGYGLFKLKECEEIENFINRDRLKFGIVGVRRDDND